MVEEHRNRQRWLEAAFIFAAWTIFGLVLANQMVMQSGLRGQAVSWAYALRYSLLDVYQWALATVAIFWLVRRVPLERGRVLRNTLIHVAGAVVLALARVAFQVALSRQVEWMSERSFARHFWVTSPQNLLVYVLLLGIAHAVIYRERFIERERAAKRLAAGLADARLQALKMQLQPHFLFNTLNAISALIPPEARPARRMVAQLGDLLRLTLEHEDRQEVTLREELAFLQPYLEIEQARFGGRLTISIDAAPETLHARVPHLMLQPLVENAIRYGIAERMGPGRVEVVATRAPDGRVLHVEVRDDGPGLDRGGAPSRGTGVGLANVRARLEQLYDGEARLAIANRAEEGAVVHIAIPMDRDEAATA